MGLRGSGIRPRELELETMPFKSPQALIIESWHIAMLGGLFLVLPEAVAVRTQKIRRILWQPQLAETGFYDYRSIDYHILPFELCF